MSASSPAGPTSTRPRQVTMGGWLAVAGGFLLVLALYDALGAIGSTEMRRSVAEVLSEPPADGLGISVDDVLSLVRVMVFASAAAAAAAAVLGWFVLQGHRAARVGLSVAAAVLVLTSPFGGGFLAILVAVAATLTWSGPARDWFAGRPVRTEPAPRTSVPERRGSEVEAGPATPRTELPAPPAPPAPAWPAWSPQPPGLSGPAPQSATPRAQRPASVVRACWVTWISCGVVLVVQSLMLLLVLLARDAFVTELERQDAFVELGLETDLLLRVLWISASLSILLAIAGAGVAVGLWIGQPWSRPAIIALSGLAVLVGLLALPIGLLAAAPAGYVVGLVLARATKDWVAGP